MKADLMNFYELIDAVIEQIKVDIALGDTTAIAEMLAQMPAHLLAGYLPESDE